MPAVPAAPPATYTIAVRALCEFAAKRGDLDLRFAPGPSALEGIAGHAVVAGRRDGNDYRRELTLVGRHGALQVRGRADGFDAARNRLEEVKTHRGDLARQPQNHRELHWAQAQVYGALLCAERGLAEIELALVYFDVGSQRETVFSRRCSAAELQQFFESLCERFQAWAEQELAHRAARDAGLAALAFPQPAFRAGQRELAAAVWRGAASGRHLLAQAPTGIGKTLGTLFPLLKAAPGRLDTLAFLTAKGSGRALALEAARQLREAAARPPLRVLELVARDHACEHPDKACHGASCPLARGFYDRLPAARQAACDRQFLDAAGLREVALAHAVCPYHLGQEMARWADLVVGDYNHGFDLYAMLPALAQANDWRVGLLVDEAHNLVERARSMYSAELRLGALRAAAAVAPAALKKPLDKLKRRWMELLHEREPFSLLDELPDGFALALQQFNSAVSDAAAALLDAPPAEGEAAMPSLPAALRDFHFDALHFARLLDSFGDHSQLDLAVDRGGRAAEARLTLRNLVPAPFLAPRWQAAHSATLFSATLAPQAYYRDLLGLPEDTGWIDVDAPFHAGQLAVTVVGDVSTRWRDRARSLDPIAELIAAQYARAPGNYLAFFSSFDYLRQAAARLAELAPQLPLWQQAPGMDPAERARFLERFAPGGTGVGFAVLGGVFAEGVDLPGDRLIGAFVATLGLPQFNPVNEALSQRLQQRFGAGHAYAYLYPGLRKVVQAAGRVIRTPEDRGVLFLIDDRFRRREVQALLPRWWRLASRGEARSGEGP